MEGTLGTWKALLGHMQPHAGHNKLYGIELFDDVLLDETMSVVGHYKAISPPQVKLEQVGTNVDLGLQVMEIKSCVRQLQMAVVPTGKTRRALVDRQRLSGTAARQHRLREA
ncbi:unnamed protein product, partial [Dovyalis caffra]